MQGHGRRAETAGACGRERCARASRKAAPGDQTSGPEAAPRPTATRLETSLAPEGGGRRSAPLRAEDRAGGTPRKAKGKGSGEGRGRPRAVRGWFNNGWKGRSAHSPATPTPRHLRAPVLSILWWLGDAPGITIINSPATRLSGHLSE